MLSRYKIHLELFLRDLDKKFYKIMNVQSRTTLKFYRFNIQGLLTSNITFMTVWELKILSLTRQYYCKRQRRSQSHLYTDPTIYTIKFILRPTFERLYEKIQRLKNLLNLEQNLWGKERSITLLVHTSGKEERCYRVNRGESTEKEEVPTKRVFRKNRVICRGTVDGETSSVFWSTVRIKDCNEEGGVD